jgi:hypothetical protein
MEPNIEPNTELPAIKTEAETENQKNQNFGSVRLSSVRFTVFGDFFCPG